MGGLAAEYGALVRRGQNRKKRSWKFPPGPADFRAFALMVTGALQLARTKLNYGVLNLCKDLYSRVMRECSGKFCLIDHELASLLAHL
jgi:hypothetical protein